MQITIDEQIIKDCISNKREAQYALYKLCYQPFIRICLRYTKSKDEASEILNKAFLKIFQKLDTYNSEGSIVGWMQRVVVNTALDHLKSERKYYKQENIEDVSNEQFTEMETTALQSEDLLKMVRSLPTIQSQVFNLFGIEGYTHAEVAEKLDITEATSKWHLFNARKALQNMIKINNAN